MPRDERNAFFVRAFRALTNIALAQTKNPAQAEDLAQEAILQAWPDWTPQEDLRSFVSRASALMRQNWFNERRATRRRQDPQWMKKASSVVSGLRRTPEELAASRELKERLFARAREELKDDPVGTGILEQTLEGNDRPAEQAAALGVDIAIIRNARRRVARVVDAIAEAEGGAKVAGDWDADESRGEDGEEEEVEVKS